LFKPFTKIAIILIFIRYRLPNLQAHFPQPSILAKSYLTVSASSVPLQATFSTCGLILNLKGSARTGGIPGQHSYVYSRQLSYKYFPVNRTAAEM